MTNTNNSSLGVTGGDAGTRSSTKAGVIGFIMGLATAGLLYLVTRGKGKRSDSAPAENQSDESHLPPTADPADIDAHDVDDDAAAEEPVDHHAPSQAGQKKLTDEDVATIRMMKDGGKSVKEIAALYGVSPKTIYARLRKQNSNSKKQENNGSEE